MKTTHFTKLSVFTIAAILLLSVLTGCGDTAAPQESTLLKVGVCAGPYGDMFLQAIAPSLEEKGYTVELVEFSDYVQPNKALAEGELNLNMFQHSVYLKNFSEEYNLDLKYITEIPTAGMGIFSQKLTSIDDVPDGATVAIPNDVTNLARAIRVLAQTGLVTIDPGIDPGAANQNTLSENPKNLTFVEIEAPQLPRSLESVDIAVINGNYALSAGLDLSSALYNEALQDGYVNVIAIRTEDANKQFVKDIVTIVHSDVFRSVIDDPANHYAAFFKPKDYDAQ